MFTLKVPIANGAHASGFGGLVMADPPLILVVDDEQSYHDALWIALQREGFLVETAADGPEAIARFDATRPALVLLDVMLPKISGVDVCRDQSAHRVPIIMVTARNSEIDAVVGLEVGADDYVTKPFRSASSSPGCAPRCGGFRQAKTTSPTGPRCWTSATSGSTPAATRCSCAASRLRCRSRSSSCSSC